MKCLSPIANCELHVFSFHPVDSRMYILFFDKKTIVIDPCINQEAFEILEKKNVQYITIFLTHEHFDHISGVNRFKENYHCHVICTDKCSKLINDPKKNFSLYFDALVSMQKKEEYYEGSAFSIEPFSCTADWSFSGKFLVKYDSHEMHLVETPGHSVGSMCVIVDHKCIFTGDSLLKGMPVITRFPGGSSKEYNEITKRFFLSLPKSMFVYPGHGESARLSELLDHGVV